MLRIAVLVTGKLYQLVITRKGTLRPSRSEEGRFWRERVVGY